MPTPPKPPPPPPFNPDPRVIGYRGPHQQVPGPSDGSTQRVFDTVAGPNLRVKDNLIQLAACGGGLVLGALIGAIVASSKDVATGAVIGGIGGLIFGLFASGITIGIVRFVQGRKKS